MKPARAPRLTVAAMALALSLGSAIVNLGSAIAGAQTPPPAPIHFRTLPPGAALPSEAQCEAAIAPSSWEPRPANYAANHRRPGLSELLEFHLRPIKGTYAPIADFARVTGDYTGTTEQILRWGACKWGIDEDVVNAEAVAESHWRQADTGDPSSHRALCPPGSGFPGAWDGLGCKQSYGILQMKFGDFGGWPLSKDSTAFNVDFRLAYQRACMNGDIDYLAQRAPKAGYPAYPHGDTQQMLWGCMGDWFSGGWFDPPAINYIASVKLELAKRSWLRSQF